MSEVRSLSDLLDPLPKWPDFAEQTWPVSGERPSADQLERLNANLEALVSELKLQREALATTKEQAPTEQQ